MIFGLGQSNKRLFFSSINLVNKNGSVITVSGYAECLNYQAGGYLHSNAAPWGNTTQPVNQIIGIISLISILAFMATRKVSLNE